jgi:LPS export ABC transporter protein LptC
MGHPLKKNDKVLIAILIAVGAFFYSCKNDIQVVQELGEEDNAPFQTTYNGRYIFTDSGQVRNILSAGKLEQFIQDSDYTKVSEGLILEIYNRSENLAGKLAANKGYYFESLNKMEAKENVIFSNPNGDSLFTESLVWQSDSNLIYTTDLVTIVREGTEIRGKGLRSNEDFSRYTILAPVGDITVPEEKLGNGSQKGQ